MHTGFVLKNFLPRKQKLLLLDSEQGSLEVVLMNQPGATRLCNGALITYHLEERRPLPWISAINIIDMPFAWAREDILFLHHILEIVQQFAPPSQPQPHIFALLADLYNNPVSRSILFKKQLLAQLFLMFGLPSSDTPPPHALSVQELDRWLLNCVREHPYHELFKTAHFLTSKKSVKLGATET